MKGAGNMTQKEYLDKLKKSDPQFYNMMMQASDELDLPGSDEEEDGDEEGGEGDSERGGAIFQVPEKFEVEYIVCGLLS